MTQDYIAFEGIIEQQQRNKRCFYQISFLYRRIIWQKGQIKIKVLLDGKVEYRGSLAKMKSNFHILVLQRSKKTTWERFWR